MDKVNRKRRSEIMSGVRSTRNRSTEWKLRSAFIRIGLTGWKLTVNDLVGKPDFVFPNEKLVVFVHGCFWHACSKCKRNLPKSRILYWHPKIKNNSLRDIRQRKKLRLLGWKVIKIWEHELRDGATNVALNIQANIKILRKPTKNEVLKS